MRKMKVFVVDDDRDFVESIVEVMEEKGYEVESAFSGEEAVQRLNEMDFDLTFMDVKMPGMNGVECLQKVRKTKPAIKVVMMTGYSVEELLAQAIEDGALGILNKPFDVDKLIEMLEKERPAPIILVADDDPDFVQSVQEILTDSGYSIEIAHTGQEAIDKLLGNDIDILLLDLRMPMLNGLQAYEQLKKQGRTVPTIVITGYAKEEANAIKKLHRISAKTCLVKPIEPEELLKSIKALQN